VSSLLGVLKQQGVDVELFDTTFYKTEENPADFDRVENLQVSAFNYADLGIAIKEEDVFVDFRKHVERFQPDVIMISMVESTYEQGINLLKSVKDIKPYVIAGGVFVILAPDVAFENELIDAVCVGEGEDAVVEFCTKFVSGEDYTGVPGMWFRKGENAVKNPIKKLVDVNTMPFLDFSLYPKERFYKPMQGRLFKMVPIEFSRGCPYRCAYCANHALERHFKAVGRWYRWKSMDRIFAEIEEYINKYKIGFFYFVSESFLSMPHKMFDEFCERYSRFKIPFWFNTRPETITKDVLSKLEDINCFRIGIGLEHGNPEFRKKMLNRKASNERIIEACHLIETSRISYSINNIIGFPGETRELVFDTIRLNKQIHPDSVGTFIFTPFRGTDLYDYCLKHGYIEPDAKVGDLNRVSVLENNTLSQIEIKGLLRTFPLYVYFPEEYFSLIEKAEHFDDDGNRIFRELAERYIEEHFKKSK
jgi:radical SAM superfamily enzyme YgiQ (UPF0313 family)